MEGNQWIKNLAGAKYHDGIWELQNPEVSKSAALEELNQYLSHIYLDLEKAQQIFNHYRSKDQSLKVLISKSSANQDTPRSVTLLLGSAKVCLENRQGMLIETVSFVKNFQKEERVAARYVPQFDQFGGLNWRSDSGSVITKDQMIKKLLHDVCHTVFLAGARRR